jgi:hypothetical protein
MKYSKGIMWLDDCRIPFVDEKVPRLNVSYEHKTNNNFGGGNDNRHRTSTQSITEGQGRFTPNLLVCDDMLNDGVITKTLKSIGANRTKEQTIYGGGKGFPTWNGGHNGDSGSSSRYYDLDMWFDKVINEL